MVKIETTCGIIKLEVNEEAAPITTANFLGYVREGFYDGTIFHRVINDLEPSELTARSQKVSSQEQELIIR